MPPSASYLDYLKDLLAPFGEITTRRMFGGAGVYCDGAIIAIVDEHDLWLKADAETRGAFEAAGRRAFTVEMNGKIGSMSYYEAPEAIFDDEDALRHWVGLALDAAARAKKPKKKAAKKKAARKKGS